MREFPRLTRDYVIEEEEESLSISLFSLIYPSVSNTRLDYTFNSILYPLKVIN